MIQVLVRTGKAKTLDRISLVPFHVWYRRFEAKVLNVLMKDSIVSESLRSVECFGCVSNRPRKLFRTADEAV